MNNLEKYNKVFMETFEINESQLKGLKYNGIKKWDSVGHMTLIAAIENEFNLMLDTSDIINFSSYEKGQEILSKEEYGHIF